MPKTITVTVTKTVFYFASKKCHSKATEAAMKEIPGCVVTEVKFRR